MPQNPDHTWRPFTDVDRAQAVNYMQNLVRSGNYTDAEIIQMTGARFDWHNSDLLTGYNLVRQAHRSVDAAQQLNQPGGGPPGLGGIPNVPTSGTGVGQVIHDVWVSATDPDTGQKYDFRGEVIFPRPMTADQIREWFEADPQRLLKLRGTPRPKQPDLDALDITPHILDVGRGVASGTR